MIQNKSLALILFGVVIGLLIAPDKGSETRKKISNTINGLTNYIEDNFIDQEQDDEISELSDLQVESYSSL